MASPTQTTEWLHECATEEWISQNPSLRKVHFNWCELDKKLEPKDGREAPKSDQVAVGAPTLLYLLKKGIRSNRYTTVWLVEQMAETLEEWLKKDIWLSKEDLVEYQKYIVPQETLKKCADALSFLEPPKYVEDAPDDPAERLVWLLGTTLSADEAGLIADAQAGEGKCDTPLSGSRSLNNETCGYHLGIQTKRGPISDSMRQMLEVVFESKASTTGSSGLLRDFVDKVLQTQELKSRFKDEIIAFILRCLGGCYSLVDTKRPSYSNSVELRQAYVSEYQCAWTYVHQIGAVEHHKSVSSKKEVRSTRRKRGGRNFYRHWTKKVSPEIKKNHPGIPGNELNSLLSKKWKLVSEEEKKALKAEYQSLPIENGETPSKGSSAQKRSKRKTHPVQRYASIDENRKRSKSSAKVPKVKIAKQERKLSLSKLPGWWDKVLQDAQDKNRKLRDELKKSDAEIRDIMDRRKKANDAIRDLMQDVERFEGIAASAAAGAATADMPPVAARTQQCKRSELCSRPNNHRGHCRKDKKV